MRKLFTIMARIAAIGGIGFISLFALDVFALRAAPVQRLVALFMHLLPGLGIAAVLVLAWRRPLPGGLLFLAVASAFLLLGNPFWVNIVLAAPFAAAGLLFILGENGPFDRRDLSGSSR
jgi:hypothetical protein